MAALWGAMAGVYKNMDCKISRDEFAAHQDKWKQERRIWYAVGGFLVVTHVGLIAEWAEALWKWFVTLA
jgi:hypothetical protein